VTCGKTQGYLAKRGIETVEEVNAGKKRMGEKEALELAKGADELYAAKGKKVVHIDLRKEKPDRATLLGLLLGPTGNLRAPTLRKGKTLIVGFDEETYSKVLR
jgi:arsenate reductase-like glutaredoxin family protein